MAKKHPTENLVLLTALQMAGFIVLELIIWVLLAIDMLPSKLVLKSTEKLILEISTGYIVVVALIIVLAAGLWLALLVEVLQIVELSDIKLKV